jgi:peptide chain release factor subunit 1
VTATESLAPETALPSAAPAPEVLERLATVHAGGPVVVSLYVRLDVQDRIRNRYRIAARDALRRAREMVDQFGLARPEHEALQRDIARVEAHLENAAALPHSPGLALFACESLGLFEVLPLPRVLQTRVLLGERPRLAEALAAVEGFGRILVALIDRTHARFFEVTAFEVREVSDLFVPATRGGKYHSDRADSPGWGEHHFHTRIREERHRHSAGVAQQLAALVAAGPCQGIVLAGPTRTIMDQQRFLPRALAERVVGTVRLNPTAATSAEVRKAALEARTEWERAHESSVLAEVEQGIGTGWAVNGARPALRALGRGQVRVLIVPAGQAGSGYRCALSGRLVLARGDCQGEGDPVPIPDLVSEALEEALRQHVEVEVIDDPEIETRVDGLAALLRFR